MIVIQKALKIRIKTNHLFEMRLLYLKVDQSYEYYLHRFAVNTLTLYLLWSHWCQ